MLFSKKNKDGNRAVNVAYIDGIDGYTINTAVEVSLNSKKECLTIKARAFKKPEVNLKLDQITGVEVKTETEILEASKSTVGRAVVGGVLLGPLGAIVGGISGIGNKKKQDTKYYMIVNYKSQSEEIKVLSFEIVGSSLHWSSFVQELKSKITPKTLEIGTETEIYL